MKLSLLLCWLNIHQYKIIDVTYGFGTSDSIKTLEVKSVESRKLKKTN